MTPKQRIVVLCALIAGLLWFWIATPRFESAHVYYDISWPRLLVGWLVVLAIAAPPFFFGKRK
jgi:hypothetical protein